MFRDGSKDPVWSWLVIVLSAVGTVSAFTGAVAGIRAGVSPAATAKRTMASSRFGCFKTQGAFTRISMQAMVLDRASPTAASPGWMPAHRVGTRPTSGMT